MKAEKPPFWVLSGPLLLLGAVTLLFCRAALVIGRPAWMFGLGTTIILASGICYLVFKELGFIQQGARAIQKKKEQDLTNLRSVLEETHLIYRDKIAKLEEMIQKLEEEQTIDLTAAQSALDALQAEHDTLFAQFLQHQSHAASLKVSLEDALDELRQFRQADYLYRVFEKRVPKDLANQHRQLREQFDEKSAVLDQTRRRLFVTEGHLLALQKEKDLTQLDLNPEQDILLHQIKELIEENQLLDQEISFLEQLVGFRPTLEKKPKKPKEEALEFQFESLITH